MNSIEAKKINIADYLASIGHEPVKDRGCSLWFLSPLRSEAEPSFKVNTERNEWYDFGVGKGGDLLAFICEHNHCGVSQALKILAEYKPTAANSFSFRQQTYQSFENLKIKPLQNASLLAYLSNRKIDLHIAQEFCKEAYWRRGEKNYFAVAFENVLGGFELRNPYYKGCLGSKTFSIIENGSREVCIFEGFIDFLSLLTLSKRLQLDIKRYDYVVLNSVTNLTKSFETLSPYGKIHSYLDNDHPGKEALSRLKIHFNNRIIDHSRHYKNSKDINEFISL